MGNIKNRGCNSCWNLISSNYSLGYALWELPSTTTFFQLHPVDIVDILVENVSFPAINVTSIHVIGWVLPLCREIWSQMRWSNFEKGFFTCKWVTFLLEPVHSSESECTGWTNRRIVLTKYHTARALEKLIWFKKDFRRDFIGRQWLEQNRIIFLHKIKLWRQRVSKLAASLPEYFAHAFSMAPSPQHGRVRKCSFPWTSRYCILFVHRRGIIIIIIIIILGSWANINTKLPFLGFTLLQADLKRTFYVRVSPIIWVSKPSQNMRVSPIISFLNSIFFWGTYF